MEERISIQRENVLNAYRKATEEQKALLENMFGKGMFKPKNIMERVKTFEDACEVLGEEHSYVQEYRGIANVNFDFTQDIIAYLKLRIICAALNDGWKPTFDKDEYRFYPLFYTEEEYDKLDKEKKKECRFVGYESECYPYFVSSSCTAMTCTNLNFSARLTFRTPELAKYCGCQFIDIWADYLFA